MKAWITKDEKNNIEFVVCDDEVGDDREIFRYTSLFAFQPLATQTPQDQERGLLFSLKLMGLEPVGPILHDQVPTGWKPEWVQWSVCVDVVPRHKED